MASTHPTPRKHLTPSLPKREEIIRMYDGAMSHLARARRSESDEQKRSISSVVKILNHLKEASERTPAPEEDGTDLSALYGYMIDRLSISHSGLGIDPINEVNWLIRNLKELSAAPKGQSPVSG